MAKIIVKLAMVPVGASLIACLGGGDRGSESSPAADMIHVAVPEIRVEGTLPADASAWHAAVAVHYFVDAFTAHPRWVVGEETAGLEGVISVKPPNDRAEVAVAGEFWSNTDRSAIPLVYSGEWECPPAADDAQCGHLAASRFVAGLTAVYAVARGGEAEVREALGAADRNVVLAGVHAAQRHPDPGLVPALAAHLDDGDRELLLATVGALTQAGDPSVVPEIIDAVDLTDVDLTITVIPPIARLGGPEARAFLQALAEGHESVRVRVRARDFLESPP